MESLLPAINKLQDVFNALGSDPLGTCAWWRGVGTFVRVLVEHLIEVVHVALFFVNLLPLAVLPFVAWLLRLTSLSTRPSPAEIATMQQFCLLSS
jgi:hypothetical protein